MAHRNNVESNNVETGTMLHRNSVENITDNVKHKETPD